MMNNIKFVNPEFFFLLLLLLPLIFFWVKTKKKEPVTFKISSLKGLGQIQTPKAKWLPVLKVLRMIALALLILGLARPQSTSEKVNIKVSDGVDIVLAVDVSGSMLARDFKPNRLEAVKQVAQNFAKNRVNDRLGVVVYASEAYTKTPVTNDQVVIADAIQSIEYNRLMQDGTGIGVGLGTAINRLKNSPAKSKVVILMTDGVNNAGLINPTMAADMAKEYGIKVYTIGIGSNGMAEMPYRMDDQGNIQYQKMKVQIDEDLLKAIAKKTGGTYFRATDQQTLQKIYNDIDQMEKNQNQRNEICTENRVVSSVCVVGIGVVVIGICI